MIRKRIQSTKTGVGKRKTNVFKMKSNKDLKTPFTSIYHKKYLLFGKNNLNKRMKKELKKKKKIDGKNNNSTDNGSIKKKSSHKTKKINNRYKSHSNIKKKKHKIMNPRKTIEHKENDLFLENVDIKQDFDKSLVFEYKFLLNQYEGNFIEKGIFQITENCIKHLNKKSKYFFTMKGDYNISPGFCSRCAINLIRQNYQLDEIRVSNQRSCKET